MRVRILSRPLAALAIAMVPAWLPAAPPAALARTRFPAQGRTETLLDIALPGRYTLLATSQQGARLQIVDRMIGPAESSGKAGEADGRLDLFLDAGRYKLWVDSPAKGLGDVALEVKSSQELHGPELPALQGQTPVRTTLMDQQQRSWRLRLAERKVVYLEAQGRSLADLRIWKDGAWLMDARVDHQASEPVKGRPEHTCLLMADLGPGEYRLTAYGGAALRWASETPEHPLSLDWGFSDLPVNARMAGTLPPSGRLRFRVPKGADTYLLQLAEKHPMRMEVTSLDAGEPLAPPEASAAIDTKSADPECKVRHETSKAYALVTLVGTPGEAFTFQCLDQPESFTFQPPAAQDYRLATLHSGHADDAIDATCILVATDPKDGRSTPVAADVIPLGRDKGWARRFNLLDESSVFFFVEEPGDYQIQASGTEARFRFEPFLVHPPADHRTPPFKTGGGTFSLDRGYWVLTIAPASKGILRVALQQKGFLERLKDWALGSDPAAPGLAKASSTLPRVNLDPATTYTLYRNRQPGVDMGLSLRPLPLALEQSVPVSLHPGEQTSLPVIALKDSRLERFVPPGASLACFVDGKPWTRDLLLGAGKHDVWLRNDGPRSLAFSIQGVPAPPPPADRNALPPGLPALSDKNPVFLDLGVKEARTATLSVATPGLYRIETTGLLKTALTLRSAVRTRLFSAEANGTGRNALLSQFLKEGTYLLTVQALDESAGRTGLRVRRTEITEGGPLTLGQEAKAEIPAHHGLAYTFEIPAADRYTLQALGQGRTFPCRLEDSEGWPLLGPSIDSRLTETLPPGRYRFLNLPLDIDTQRLTTVAPAPKPRRVEGKGPHPLRLNEKVEAQWREDETRSKDLFQVSLPADLEVEIALDNPQMQAWLHRIGAPDAPIPVFAGRGWRGTLLPGDYRIEVACSREDDRVDYTLALVTPQLAPGLSQDIAVPGTLEVRLAREAVVEIFSRGQLDVRGMLTQHGAPVDASDDAFRDWNFRIARRLPAGHYQLGVEAVGGATGKTTVAMAAPPERPGTPLADGDHTLDLGGALNTYPLRLDPQTEVLSILLSGNAEYGCILERGDGLPVVSRTGPRMAFDVPVATGGTYQLRLWSADHQSEQVQLQVKSTPAGSGPYARLRMAQGGTFTPMPKEDFTFATGQDSVFQPAGHGLVALPAGESLVRWPGKTPGRLERVVLQPGAPLRVRLNPGLRQELDVKVTPDGPTLVLARPLSGRIACMPLASGTPRYDSRAYRMDADQAVAVLPPGTPGRVLLWDPEETAPVSEGTVALLQAGPLPAPEPLAPGSHQRALPAGSARQWQLPEGLKQLDLVLEDGLAAYLAGPDGPSEVTLAREDAAHASWIGTGTRLVVMNPTSRAAAFSLQVLPRQGEAGSATVAEGTPFERIFPRAGTLRLDVTPGKGPRVLEVVGTQLEARWMDDRGILYTGSRFDLAGSGTLSIAHGPGLVKAWLSRTPGSSTDRWGKTEEVPTTPILANQVDVLEGHLRAYTFQVQQASAFQVKVDAPAVVRLTGTATDLVAEGTPDTRLGACLQPGSYRAWIRAFPGDILRGTASFSLVPVTPLERTLGPERLIREGETHLYTFAAKTKGAFGIGLKASQEGLDTQVLRMDGTELGRGSQQFLTLEPGTYLLQVTLPPGSGAAKYAPVVAGLEPPGTGPTPEALQTLLEDLGMNP